MSTHEWRRRFEECKERGSSELDLSYLDLREVPEGLPYLLLAAPRITNLNLNSNNISVLPKDVGGLIHLRSLSVSNNFLNSLPDGLERLANLVSFSCSRNRLRTVPAGLGKLAGLIQLKLHQNKLETLPAELGALAKLRYLSLHDNQLRALPKSLGRLINLERLWLNNNRLESVPAELGKLENLTHLWLSNNQLVRAPAELGDLKRLHRLALHENKLEELPEWLGGLANLAHLTLHDNQLRSIPRQLGDLGRLLELSLSKNLLESIPSELGQLKELTHLWLYGNRLRSLPAQLGGMKRLAYLSAHGNQLRSLPDELGALPKLATALLHNNQLQSVPADFGRLASLTHLSLSNNQLVRLPTELGRLSRLERLECDDNPLVFPPPEVIQQGTREVLRHLRDAEDSQPVWSSKLVLVGQGAVGKTSLLRRLRGLEHRDNEDSTHGMEIHPLNLPHPTRPNIMMELRSWDFGGQEIYYATHQFFLSNRSLFLLVWNGRMGYENSLVEHWLELIVAKAPDSPILLIATRTDEGRASVLPFEELKQRYPKIQGSLTVSNKSGEGVADVLNQIARIAADPALMPLMGEPWKRTWRQAAEKIRALAQDRERLWRRELWDDLNRGGFGGASDDVLKEEEFESLLKWLHELGQILYFSNDLDLREVVVLQPKWVNEMVCRVLDSQDVRDSLGIFRRVHQNEIWRHLAPEQRTLLLKLMDQFDLSYLLNNGQSNSQDLSLVVAALPSDPTPDRWDAWELMRSRPATQEVSMSFTLGMTWMPPGIPSWFLARTHRFTMNMHWRYGAIFSDRPGNFEHLGLIRAFPVDRKVQLTVRGPSPIYFFSVLRDGLELTLKRYPGMRVTRTVPCRCGGVLDRGCPHDYDLEVLLRRTRPDAPRVTIECVHTARDVDVHKLLYGIERPPMRYTDREQKELAKYEQREYLKSFELEQRFSDSECPAVFSARIIDARKIEIQLYCHEPGCWHPIGGAKYEFETAPAWAAARPLFRKLPPLFQHGGWDGIAQQFEDVLQRLPRGAVPLEPGVNAEQSALRQLRRLLSQFDPTGSYGGLCKMRTPEGVYLWLCPEHIQPYLSKRV